MTPVRASPLLRSPPHHLFALRLWQTFTSLRNTGIGSLWSRSVSVFEKNNMKDSFQPLSAAVLALFPDLIILSENLWLCLKEWKCLTWPTCQKNDERGEESRIMWGIELNRIFMQNTCQCSLRWGDQYLILRYLHSPYLTMEIFR